MFAPVTLVNVMVISEFALAATVVGEKTLVSCGLAICNVAAPSAVLAPPLLVSPPTGIILP